MTRRKRERLHSGFTHEDSRHKSDSSAIRITDADLHFLQALSRLR